MAEAVSFREALCVIATNTYYNPAAEDDAFRRDLFRTTVEKFAELDAVTPGAYPLVVSDTSPDHEEFKAELEQLFPGIIVLDGRANKGIGPQTIQSITFAYDHDAVYALRIDPEKYGQAKRDILEAIVAELDNEESDIIAVGRAPGFPYESLPTVQQWTERVMSRQLASIGLPEDTASGTRAMNRLGMWLLMGFDTVAFGRQWEYLWFPLVDAIVDGTARVGQMFIDTVHPRPMTDWEMGRLDADPQKAEARKAFFDDKRVQQAAMIVPAVLHYAIVRGLAPRWDPEREWVI